MPPPAPVHATGAERPRAGAVYLIIALLAASLAAVGWASRGRVPLLHNLEGQVVDTQLRARGPIAPGQAAGTPEIAILMVDDRSIEEIGSLPVDRRIVAGVVDRLRADGAAWIVFDMLFAEPARRQPETDRALAEAIARAGNVLLAYALPDDGPPAATDMPDAVLDSAYLRYRHEDLGARIDLRPARLLAPIAPLAGAAAGLGHVSVKPGADGTLRYDLPALPYADELFPSLAVTVAARVIGARWEEVEARLGDSIRIGTLAPPLDPLSRQWVNYYGPAGTFATHSLADYAAGRLDPALFRDRVVLIGGTALGNSDRNPSPFDPMLPGVERVATVLDNILTQRWLQRPGWAAPVELAAMLALPLLAVWLIARLPPLPALGLLGLISLAAMAAAQGVFVQQRQFLSMAFPLFALLVASGLGLTWRARLDLRSRKRAEADLRASEQRYALAAAGANDGLWDWDIERHQVYFSARARQLIDLGRIDASDDDGAITTGSFNLLLDKLDRVERDQFQRELDEHLAGGTRQFNHVIHFERAGEMRWLLARGVAVRENSRPVRMAGSLTDITEQKRLERQIAFDALHDRLTGLANRELFTDRVSQLLAPRGDREAPTVTLILVDIDGFRAINEQHGQIAGNAVLVEAASRLAGFKRVGCLVSRLGGDQFALAVAGPDAGDAHLAERVRGLFDAPFRIDAGKETVTATVTWAHTGQGLSSTDELLAAATLAIGHARRHGPGQIGAFDPAVQELENTRRWLDENIDRALAAGDQFKLYYQPFVRLSDRRLIGFEALIRWHHPERGQIMPGDFIPHAERSGRINAIGRWCLFEVARQMLEWNRIGFDGEIAVNLSGRQFTETDLEADAREVLALLGDIPPKRYKFEVTESMAMENPQRTTEVLKRLAAMGFKISIDDFGTGYSSLAYLHRFPFDTLKIDRSFVIRLGSGREAQEIVRTIVGLGAALDKQVLAEGVEDEAQAASLHALGVHVGQGWLFARALPAADAGALILRDQPLP